MRRIGLVIWDPTIDVIAAAMASFTKNTAIRAVFCLSALYLLCIGVRHDFGRDDVDCKTGRLCLRDRLSLAVALLDGDVVLVVGERVRRFAAKTDHAIGRFFE